MRSDYISWCFESGEFFFSYENRLRVLQRPNESLNFPPNSKEAKILTAGIPGVFRMIKNLIHS